MNHFNYYALIGQLKMPDNWEPKRIKLELTTEQFMAILKGYMPSMDFKFGLFYNPSDQYFYTFRSGFVLGKYKIDITRNNVYSCIEMYDNPEKTDGFIIFECVREACWRNHVDIDLDALSQMATQTRSINGKV